MVSKSVTDEKKRLRRETISRLHAVSAGERDLWDNLIRRNVITSPEFSSAKCLMNFAAMKGEPDLLDVALEAVLRKIMVTYPRSSRQERKIRAVRVTDPVKEIRAHEYHPQPSGGQVVAPEEIDLVMVPGICFDQNGGRLGRGHGVFDRFLARLRPEAVKMGVCYELQVTQRLPRDEHDMNVDMTVTEKGIHRFNG